MAASGPEPGDDLSFGWGLATGQTPEASARRAAESALERAGGDPPDLALVFVSRPFAAQTATLAQQVNDVTGARHVLAVSAQDVIGGAEEPEGAAAVSVLVGSWPNASIRPFTHADLQAERAADIDDPALFRAALGLDDENARGALLFVDPFSVPISGLLKGLADSIDADDRAIAPVLGGVASAGTRPGQNILAVDGQAVRSGFVGLTLRGDIRIDTVVSQGCRPIGPRMVVTKAKGNLVMQLGGRPAITVVKEIVHQLGEDERDLLAGGLYVGIAVDEFKEHLGRGDFLVWQIMAAEESSGSIAVGDVVRVGKTVQLHLHDRATADEDLGLLMDAQQLYERPAGALLVSCNGRGRKLFSEPDHDARAIQQAFRMAEAGPELARGGQALGGDEPTVPLAGLFAAGEIGPIAGRPYLHGHTASIGLFRPRRSSGS